MQSEDVGGVRYLAVLRRYRPIRITSRLQENVVNFVRRSDDSFGLRTSRNIDLSRNKDAEVTASDSCEIEKFREILLNVFNPLSYRWGLWSAHRR